MLPMDATVSVPTAGREKKLHDTPRVAPSNPNFMNESGNTGAAFLPPSTVAAMLSVCTATIYRLIHRRELPASRVARRLRIARADVENFLGRTRDPLGYVRA